jgi:hypothetical protein
MTVQPGDIYSVFFKYEDRSGGKTRPVLIVDVENDIALGVAIKITSKGPKNPPTPHDAYRIPIKHWKEAGLNKESWARCEKFKAFPLSAFKEERKIGEMHSDDFDSILSVYRDLTSDEDEE